MRAVTNQVVIGACVLAAALVVLPLVLIMGHLLANGAGRSQHGLLHAHAEARRRAGGGMANAIVGTLLVVGVAALIALPVGDWGRRLPGGVRARPVRHTGPLHDRRPERRALDRGRRRGLRARRGADGALLRHWREAWRSRSSCCRRSSAPPRRWCGSCRSSYRQAALALGAPRWKTIQQVVLPAARAGHRDGRDAGGGARCGRDGAAPLHRAGEPVLVASHGPADRDSAGLHLRLREGALRRIGIARLGPGRWSWCSS